MPASRAPGSTAALTRRGFAAESVLPANIAYRVRGEFTWDAAALRSDRADVVALLRREVRPGWRI